MQREFDMLFVGTGLASGLAALRLRQRRPEIRIGLLEASDLSQRQSPTWSFHESDLDAEALACLAPFVSASWPRYEVAFSELRRVLQSKYYSLKAADFYAHLRKEFAGCLFENQRVRTWNRNSVQTESGDVFRATHLLDARGWGPPPAEGKGSIGYQKFLGLDILTEQPHGVTHPLVMDATVDQIDGYRFVYLLPWSDREILVEDTRYTLDPVLKRESLRNEVLRYVERRGWKVSQVVREETGCLPIPLRQGETDANECAIPWGVRSGLFHPTTGYSFPFAMEMAGWLANDPLTPGLKTRFFEKRDQVARRLVFFRWLNRMFFWQVPEKRYLMLQRFYRLPEATVARFYSGSLKLVDYIRILGGKPPVPRSQALVYLLENKKVQFSHGC